MEATMKTARNEDIFVPRRIKRCKEQSADRSASEKRVAKSTVAAENSAAPEFSKIEIFIKRDFKDIGRTQRDDLAVTCCDHAVNFATVRHRMTRPVPVIGTVPHRALLRKRAALRVDYNRANSIRFASRSARIQAIPLTQSRVKRMTADDAFVSARFHARDAIPQASRHKVSH